MTIPPKTRKEVARMLRKNINKQAIADAHGISVSAVYIIGKENHIVQPKKPLTGSKEMEL